MRENNSKQTILNPFQLFILSVASRFGGNKATKKVLSLMSPTDKEIFPNKPKSIILSMAIDLKNFEHFAIQVVFGVGANEELLLIYVDKITPKSPHLPKWYGDQSETKQILIFNHNKLIQQLKIALPDDNVDLIQSLGGSELLVRSHSIANPNNPGEIKRKGLVFDLNGKLLREFLLEGSIADIQTSENGNIWISYSDESAMYTGVGLNTLNKNGNEVYKFEPSAEMGQVGDCYALNVESDTSTWLYYYNNFPLVHLENFKIKTFWNIPIHGCHAFAINENYALFYGGYNLEGICSLFKIQESGVVTPVAQYRLVDPEGKEIRPNRSIGRKDKLYFTHDDKIFILCINEILPKL
jgi:hypothetical protein